MHISLGKARPELLVHDLPVSGSYSASIAEGLTAFTRYAVHHNRYERLLYLWRVRRRTSDAASRMQCVIGFGLFVNLSVLDSIITRQVHRQSRPLHRWSVDRDSMHDLQAQLQSFPRYNVLPLSRRS